jgi:hypothetical protein
VAGGWKRLHNEKLRSLYASPHIRVIKSRKMRWANHVARMGEMRTLYNVLVRHRDGRKPLRLDIKQDGMMWLTFIWLRIGTSGGFL